MKWSRASCQVTARLTNPHIEFAINHKFKIMFFSMRSKCPHIKVMKHHLRVCDYCKHCFRSRLTGFAPWNTSRLLVSFTSRQPWGSTPLDSLRTSKLLVCWSLSYVVNYFTFSGRMKTGSSQRFSSQCFRFSATSSILRPFRIGLTLM